MSAGLMQIPQSTSMPYNIQKAKNAAAPSLLQPDQIASQLGQQAIEELARLAPTNQQHVERDVARSAIGQELFDRSNFSVPPNPYLSQGPLYDRGRPVGGTVPVAGGGVGGLNFDGNTASREPCAKGAATSLMNLSDAADPVLRSSAQEAVASTTSINGQVTPQGESSSLSTQLAFNANNASVVIPEELAPAEKYGMKGLLGVLNPPQGQQGNSNISLLSLGLDLTMLGLNLNSPDPLHLSFDSPWDSSNGPNKGGWDEVIGGPRGDEPDFKLPACYYMSPPALKTSHFTKFQLETLFYIFYNLPRDVLQQLAAMELHTREWRYHKELQLWFTRAPGTDATYERGAYIYFDISSWERRPFHDANITFEQGLMGDDELHVLPVPQHMSSAS